MCGDGFPGFHPGLFSYSPYGRTAGRLDGQRSIGEGHLTSINDILTNLMEAERRIGAGR
jgi:hypothetical protein